MTRRIQAERVYRLPNGDNTRDSSLYIETWHGMVERLEERLGVEVYAFDPGFAARDKTNSRLTAEIPMWLAERILASGEEEA